MRLTHPFPSVLNGLIAAAVALVAGGGPLVAARLGLAMIAMQASIGALNDLLDVDRDAGRIPPKPIPAGQVARAEARLVCAAAAVLGLLLAAPSGLPTILLSIVGLSTGYAYDRWAKGTAWSWLPFTVAIPLVPLYGWIGTGASLPGSFVILVPCAMLAGAGLAIVNASADVDLDRASGTDSVAVRLGPRRAWAVHALLVLAALGIASLALWATRPGSVSVALCAAGAAIVMSGVIIGALTATAPETGPRARLAWESEAVGIGLFAIGWLVAQ